MTNNAIAKRPRQDSGRRPANLSGIPVSFFSEPPPAIRQALNARIAELVTLRVNSGALPADLSEQQSPPTNG